jgi:hypothetical protein
VPDRADGQIAFERTKNGFDFAKLDVLGPKLRRIAALQVSAQRVGPITTGCQAQSIAIPSPAQAQVLEVDFEVGPSSTLTLFESSQMYKNLGVIFEPAVAKDSPQPDQIAHQAAHQAGTDRTFFLCAGSTASQHIGLLIVLGNELDFDFGRDRLPVALQQSALMGFELCSGRSDQVTGPAPSQPLEIFFTDNATVKDPHPPSTTVFALDGF